MSKTGGKTPPGGDYETNAGSDVGLADESIGTGSGQPDITPRTGAGGVGSSGTKSDSNSKG